MCGCVSVGKRKVTIEEIREALRKACAEVQERDPEGSAAADLDPKKQQAKGRQQQKAPAKPKPKKATPARKVSPS